MAVRNPHFGPIRVYDCFVTFDDVESLENLGASSLNAIKTVVRKCCSKSKNVHLLYTPNIILYHSYFKQPWELLTLQSYITEHAISQTSFSSNHLIVNVYHQDIFYTESTWRHANQLFNNEWAASAVRWFSAVLPTAVRGGPHRNRVGRGASSVVVGSDTHHDRLSVYQSTAR